MSIVDGAERVKLKFIVFSILKRRMFLFLIIICNVKGQEFYALQYSPFYGIDTYIIIQSLPYAINLFTFILGEVNY